MERNSSRASAGRLSLGARVSILEEVTDWGRLYLGEVRGDAEGEGASVSSDEGALPFVMLLMLLLTMRWGVRDAKAEMRRGRGATRTVVSVDMVAVDGEEAMRTRRTVRTRYSHPANTTTQSGHTKRDKVSTDQSRLLEPCLLTTTTTTTHAPSSIMTANDSIQPHPLRSQLAS